MEVETGGVRPASARGRRQVPETGTKAGVECLLPLSPREGMGTETSGLQHCERRDFCCFKTQCRGFPGSSAGKESACSAGDPGSIPGSGRSAEEEIGYPLQYSWASLAAQLVKNPPAMWETRVWSLGWEDPLAGGYGNPLVFLPGESPWTEEPGGLQSMGSQRARHDWSTKQSTSLSVALCLGSSRIHEGVRKHILSYDTRCKKQSV